MEVAIIGAGVGGLTLALSLHHAGIKNIHLYESSDQVSELGVGINILPHAMRIMDQLGLLEELLAVSVETSDLKYYTQKGQFVWQEKRGVSAGYRWPQISIHRGFLIRTLYDAFIARVGRENLHTNHTLVDLDQQPDGTVKAIFEDSQKQFDCLIGCDGIHSAVRRKFYPNEGSPKWDGITMWRGVSLMNDDYADNAMVIAGRSQHRMVMYPISKSINDEGKRLINWVAKHKTTDAQAMPKQDWVHEVENNEIPDHFKNFDFLDVSGLLDNVSAIYKYPQVDRDPLPTWSFGPITLLGDAAHPMYPSGSNGASQAIIDAEVLCQQLQTQSDIEQAFTAYELERRPATADIVMKNRKAGPEQCIDIVEDRAPEGFSSLDQVITQQELKNIADNYKKTAGFDKQILNTKAAY